ncbi:MAG: hypothetical protein PHY12_15365, partial [Eubacteriales bacterium]|nr:hypothetical protein [Eubacteriales bacterium]
MILPIRYRDEDDSAPVDYQFVASVAEGTRRRQAEPIHEPAAPAAPVPGGRAPYPRRRDNAFARDPNYTPLSEPLQTFAPAEPVSNSRNHSYQGSPAEPVSNSRNHSYQGSPAAQAQPVQAEPPAAPPLTQTQDGSLYAQPAAPEVPDWLRVARQNNLPLEGRPRAPRVAAAPQANSRSDPGSASAAQEIPRDRLGRPLHNARPSAPLPPATDGTAAAYAAAGYPPELVSQMVEQEARERELALRRRHGAQPAEPPAEPASNSRNHSYPGSAPAALEANSRNYSYPGSAPAALEAKARYNSYPGSTNASEVNNRYPPNTFAPQANAQPSGYPADAPSPYAPQANPSSA